MEIVFIKKFNLWQPTTFISLLVVLVYSCNILSSNSSSKSANTNEKAFDKIISFGEWSYKVRNQPQIKYHIEKETEQGDITFSAEMTMYNNDEIIGLNSFKTTLKENVNIGYFVVSPDKDKVVTKIELKDIYLDGKKYLGTKTFSIIFRVVYESSWNLNSGNKYPHGITVYNNKFYVPDFSDNKVYIYSSDGTYQGSWNLTSENESPYGITVYNNKFYVVDDRDQKVYIYSSDGTYQGSYNLAFGNRYAGGMTTYDDKFYVPNYHIDDKVYIYSADGTFQSSWNLTSENNNPYGVTVYNNKFHVLDSGSKKVYIYSSDGTYESRWDLITRNGNHDNPTGITVYNNKFYVIDVHDDKVYIYRLAE